jgi:hypothetical protein
MNQKKYVFRSSFVWANLGLEGGLSGQKNLACLKIGSTHKALFGYPRPDTYTCPSRPFPLCDSLERILDTNLQIKSL